MKHIKTFLIVIVTFSVMASLSAGPNQQVFDSLERTKALYVEEAFKGDALRAISNASIYEASYGFAISETNYSMSLTRYFLKDRGSLTFFNTEYQLISSEEFLDTIKDDFALTSVEDGLVFQQFLYAVDDNYFNEGFFIDGNTWTFVRDEFFGDIEAWIVETDGNGNILSISFEYDADIVLGDDLYMDDDMSFIYNETEYVPIEDIAFAQIQAIMEEEFDYELEVSPITSSWLTKLSKATWYSCTITITEEYDDMVSSSLYEVFAFEHNGNTLLFEEVNELLTSSAFLDSIQDEFYLYDETSAELFELAIDQVSNFERTEKARFERNGSWVFIRTEFFENGSGFIVETDDSGVITNIAYSFEIPLEGVEVAIEEPFDESEVTWTFTLLEPNQKDLQIPEAQDIPVSIEFNDWAANQLGAWIGTFWQGERVGMYAGNSMTSPYTDTIPAEVLSQGDNIVTYKLLRPGLEYDNPIVPAIELSIWVGD